MGVSEDEPTFTIIKTTLRTDDVIVGVTVHGITVIHMTKANTALLLDDGEKAYDLAQGLLQAYDFINGL